MIAFKKTSKPHQTTAAALLMATAVVAALVMSSPVAATPGHEIASYTTYDLEIADTTDIIEVRFEGQRPVHRNRAINIIWSLQDQGFDMEDYVITRVVLNAYQATPNQSYVRLAVGPHASRWVSPCREYCDVHPRFIDFRPEESLSDMEPWLIEARGRVVVMSMTVFLKARESHTPEPPADTLVCESHRPDMITRCSLEGLMFSSVTLKEEFSDNLCENSWRFNERQIIVQNGCRAEFDIETRPVETNITL